METRTGQGPAAPSGEVSGFKAEGGTVAVVYFCGYSMGCNKMEEIRLGIVPVSLTSGVMPSSFGLGSTVPLD